MRKSCWQQLRPVEQDVLNRSSPVISRTTVDIIIVLFCLWCGCVYVAAGWEGCSGQIGLKQRAATAP
jgi:hypothetical protein